MRVPAVDHHPLQLQLFQTIIAADGFADWVNDWKLSLRQKHSYDVTHYCLLWKS
jgi:hypothetical protein